MSGPEAVMFAVLSLFVGVLLMFGPRRWMLPVFFITTSFAGLRLQIDAAGFNLMLYRVFLFCVWLRFITTGEIRRLQPHRLDKALIWFSCALILIGVLREGGK